jgi:hypothetical protein
MSGYRIEIAVPKKRTVTHWPTRKLTPDHCIAAFKAIVGQPMTRREKRLARNVADALIDARSKQRALDWLDAEGKRLAKVKAARNARRRKARGA